MKNIIAFVLFIYLTGSVFPQEPSNHKGAALKHVFKPDVFSEYSVVVQDSTVIEVYDTLTGTWKKHKIKIYEYDDEWNPTFITDYIDTDFTGDWIPTERAIMADGRYGEIQHWNQVSQIWTDSILYEYEDNVTTRKFWNKTQSYWENYSRYEAEYDNWGEWIGGTYYLWNRGAGSWDKESRDHTFWSSLLDAIVWETDVWSTADNEWKSFKREEVYEDDDLNISQVLYYNWNASSSEWDIYEKDEFTFTDIVGTRGYIFQFVTSKWINNSWVLSERTTAYINEHRFAIDLVSSNYTSGQYICIGAQIEEIRYKTSGGSELTISGLPEGVDGVWDSDTLTISGTPTEAGEFTYIITLTGEDGEVTEEGTITVRPIGTITLSSAPGTDNQSLVVNTPLTNITYLTTGNMTVSFEGLPAGLVGRFNPPTTTATISGTPTETGVFDYKVSLFMACGDGFATGTITVNTASSVTQTELSEPIIYPNPFSTHLSIDYDNWNPAVFELTNLNGQEIIRTQLTGRNILDVSGLENGLYFYKIISEEKIIQGRLIKIDR